MPRITNQQTKLAIEALGHLVAVKRPILGALRMRQVARVLAARMDDIEAEREKLLETYGARNADGSLTVKDRNVVFPDEAASKAFARGFAELMACAWDCPLTLRVADFGGLDTEPGFLIALGDVLEEPAEESKTAGAAQGSGGPKCVRETP